MVNRHGQMGLPIKAHGSMTRHAGRGNIPIMMVTSMKGNSKMTEWMATGCTKIEPAFNTEVIGKTTKGRERGRSTTGRNWYIRVCIRTVKSMSEEDTFGLMETNTRDSGKMTISQATVFIHFAMGVDTRGSG